MVLLIYFLHLNFFSIMLFDIYENSEDYEAFSAIYTSILWHEAEIAKLKKESV